MRKRKREGRGKHEAEATERAAERRSGKDAVRGEQADEVEADDIVIEIEGLREELAEVNNKWLRALADLDNYKKRIDRERCRWSAESREAILLDMLEVVDNFERAVACEDASAPPPDDPFREGVEMILEHLKDVLAKHDVRALEVCGTEFDPNKHEAVSQVESEEHESNQIVEEVQRGYTIGDRLLRCSRVIVAK